MRLGFGPSPQTKYINLNRQYSDCLWYFWDSANNRHNPIEHESITGYITKIDVADREFKGKESQKIQIHINCDVEKYAIVFGLDTVTAKPLLNTLNAADLSCPVTIEPKAAGSENVVFTKVYGANGDSIFVEPDVQIDALQVVELINKKLGHAPSDRNTSLNTTKSAKPAPSTSTVQQASVLISAEQKLRMKQIASEHGWSIMALRSYVKSCGYSEAAQIPSKDFAGICDGLVNTEIRDHYKEKEAVADQW